MNTERVMNVIAEELGVEMGEAFDIIGSTNNPYVIKTSGLYDCNGDPSSHDLESLIIGRYDIKKLPWMPAIDEKYYTVDPYEINGVRVSRYFGTSGDKLVAKRNLAFRTREEAAAKAMEMGIIE